MFETVQTFPCPECTTILSTASSVCKKCGLSIDPDRAGSLADQESFLIAAESDAEHAKYLATAGLGFYALVFLVVIWFARFEVWKVGPKVARSDAGNLMLVLLSLGTLVLFPVLVMAGRGLLAWKKAYASNRVDHWCFEAAHSTWKSAIQAFAALVLVYLLVDIRPLVALFLSR
jgi:hypothetical protein